MSQRVERVDTEAMVRKLQADIAELAVVIQDPKLLKEKVNRV